MKLLLVIPAYNEEESIGRTIERALAAEPGLLRESPVTELDVVVVSDGSTDRTLEIARRYEDRVTVIGFDRNRGYGAAIKYAWERSDAELLGFMDADGTCDPERFGELCRAMVGQHADVVLGSRMHRASRMPRLRRVGNVLFAVMLSTLASERVRDAASGMRVIRASSVRRLFPLPDGLHFTPAMSARALLDTKLRIVEIDVPYAERTGASKLRVLKDGVRFFRVIMQTALLYRPGRPLMSVGIVLLAAAVILMLGPLVFYVENRRVLEWMIYRFVVGELLWLSGVLFVGAGYLAGRIAALTVEGWTGGVVARLVGAVLRARVFWLIPLSLAGAGVALVVPSALSLVRTGATYEHWSRFVAMSVLFATAIVLSVLRVVDYVLDLLDARVSYLSEKSSGQG